MVLIPKLMMPGDLITFHEGNIKLMIDKDTKISGMK